MNPDESLTRQKLAVALTFTGALVWLFTPYDKTLVTNLVKSVGMVSFIYGAVNIHRHCKTEKQKQIHVMSILILAILISAMLIILFLA